MNKIIRIVSFIFLLQAGQIAAQESSFLDQAFENFWLAETPEDKDNSIAAILATGIGFEEVYQRLQAGKIYAAG